MIKFTKISFIVSAFLAVAGILLILIATLMGAGFHTLRQLVADGVVRVGPWHIVEYDFGSKGSRGDLDNSFDSSEIKHLKLDISAAEIIFTESEEHDKMDVRLKNGYVDEYECLLKDETLQIKYKLNKSMANGNHTTIYIGIPKEFVFKTMDMDIGASTVESETDVIACETLVMDVGAGQVEFDYVESTKKFDLTIGAGTADISSGTFAEVKLDCGLGQIDMEGSVAGDITAHCGMGQIDMELKGYESDYNYDLSCGLGSLTVNGTRYSSISGSRKVNNDGATKTLKADCGMGEVEISIYP